ncbi:MAG: hypothetical protein ACW99U_22235 [Candidatus Thorarchaeota archaeon]
MFYKISPSIYREAMERVRVEFNMHEEIMHEEIDEARTLLMLEDISRIELVSGMYDPVEGDVAMIRVVLNDETLKEFFDSVFGVPYKVK